MLKKYKKTMNHILGFICMALISFPSLAATDALVIGFQKPQNNDWGGWNRGSIGSVYAGWDYFEASPTANFSNDSTTDGYVTYVMRQNDPNIQPEYTEYGVMPSPILVGVPEAQIIADPGLGVFVTSTNNWYSFSDTPSYTALLLTDQHHQSITGPIIVAFQVATIGTNIDDSTVILAGIDQDGSPDTPDIIDLPFESKTTLFTDATNAHDEVIQDGYREYLYVWTIDNPQVAYEIKFAAQDSSMSLDALAIDIGPSAIVFEGNIPIIPAWGLLALSTGLILIRQKTKAHMT